MTADGTASAPAVNVSYSSFEAQCRALSTVYPQFSWRPPISRFHRDTGFLQSTRQQLDSIALEPPLQPAATGDVELLMAVEVHDCDELSVPSNPSSHGTALHASSTAVWCEWHVVYSNSYRVPVLLFQLTLADGQPLDAAAVQRAILHCSDGRSSALAVDDASAAADCPPVSCISHPALCRPFYCLHPCQTAHVMAVLQSSSALQKDGCAASDGEELNVLAWLSAVGPFVGLRLTLSSALQQLLSQKAS